jgi:hypothetical protein
MQHTGPNIRGVAAQKKPLRLNFGSSGPATIGAIVSMTAHGTVARTWTHEHHDECLRRGLARVARIFELHNVARKIDLRIYRGAIRVLHLIQLHDVVWGYLAMLFLSYSCTGSSHNLQSFGFILS